MSMGKRKGERQQGLWIPTTNLTAPGHPFYHRLGKLLADHGFDPFVEGLCQRFYSEKRVGRPSIVPGVYFRMLLIGYFEGIDSERGIAWRCADSLGLREFLGFDLGESTPDHSTLSVTRHRIDFETHQEVFGWVLKVVAEKGLLKGKTIGVDATTLEANAALRSIVRRDTGEGYQKFLEGLARASGIETPTRADLAKIDRKRPKKGSNDDWRHPGDPDAKITKMKDGRTHLAHKAEHAVDMECGAVVAVALHGADKGDTTTVYGTLEKAAENLGKLAADPRTAASLHRTLMEEVVADKGYHSNKVLKSLARLEIRGYVSEPARGRRRWEGKEEAKAAVYGNRRRVKGRRGKELLRQRGELLERPFAHCYDTGGMRRVHLRGRENIWKRLLVHVAAFNLGLVMRRLWRVGTPRSLQDLARRVWGGLFALILALIGWPWPSELPGLPLKGSNAACPVPEVA